VPICPRQVCGFTSWPRTSIGFIISRFLQNVSHSLNGFILAKVSQISAFTSEVWKLLLAIDELTIEVAFGVDLHGSLLISNLVEERWRGTPRSGG